VKILAKFLLSSVFVFLPAVVCAQGPCGWASSATDIFGRVSPEKVDRLVDNQNCLNDNLGKLEDKLDNLTKLKDKVEFLDTLVRSDAGDTTALLDELRQTKDDLQTAETKIETLENRLTTAEDEIQELKFDSRIPPHPANRKAAVNKSSGFIPETPATTPHPASKKPDATKPKAPASKPTSGFVPDFPPMSSASKPKAPDNNPTPVVKEGAH
jgi:seryl-tRNA synthetase